MTEAIPPPATGPCVVCGEPVGEELHWVVEGGARRVHHRCRDFRTAPFPFDRQLVLLRKLLRELRGAVRDVIAAGRALRRTQRSWPAHGRESYDAGEQELAAVRARLDRIVELARRLW